MAGKPAHRALITGGGGFAGSHLYPLLKRSGWAVTLFDRVVPSLFAPDSEDVVLGDLCSREDRLRALRIAEPDIIYHLAGIASVPAAEKDRRTALDVNLEGGLGLLEDVLDEAPGARVLVASSSEVYGRIRPEDVPLNEDTPLRPGTFYAMTKAALEGATHFVRARGLDAVILRPFNHIGPRQTDLYVTAAFARQVAEIEAGKREPVIRVGNTDAVRDFTDVEDMMVAYRLAGTANLSRSRYNLCSGRGMKIRKILDIYLDRARQEIRVEVDPERLRPSDTPVLVGDASRFSEETGWTPAIPFETSLIRILTYWRERR